MPEEAVGGFSVHQFVEPQQIVIGYVGEARTPFYASCGRCGAADAVMHGMVKGADGHVALRLVDGGPFFTKLYLCGACFGKEVGE